MSRLYESCALCGEEILDPRRSNVARQVVGWLLPRPSGGLSGRYETGALAHVFCVKAGKGTADAQLWTQRQEKLWSDPSS
jgi:hypothetical protein